MLGELISAELPKFEHDTIETASQIGKFEMVLPTLKPLNAKFVVNNVSAFYFSLLNTKITQYIYIKKNLSSMNGKESGITVTCGGNIKLLEVPNFEMEKEAELSFEMSLITLKYDIDKIPVLIYDVQNSSYVVDGIDIYEQIRKKYFIKDKNDR
ncbi:phage major tail tube protein [Campylobacter sputorum]|uniref:phage major tail tube protein n=1 Tax=Campylobacter sputorum TaxID=206 RepID=UPI0009DED2FC|nr:phage major tail tube protein [Campylobacter sputorum]